MSNFINEHEAASLIGVSSNTLRNTRCKSNTGVIFGLRAPTHYKFGRSVRYRLEDVQEWLNDLQESSSRSGGSNENN